MERFVLTLDLRDDPAVIAAYRQYHAEAWPEVVASLRQAGVREMDIYILGRRLVMILELAKGRDLAEVMSRHASSSRPRVVEWERMMKGFQQAPPGAPAGEWWTRMERVFHLSGEPASASAPVDAVRLP